VAQLKLLKHDEEGKLQKRSILGTPDVYVSV